MGVSVGYVGQDGWKVIVVGSVLMFMQLLMLCGRLVSRSLKKSRLQKDDMMLIIGVVSSSHRPYSSKSLMRIDSHVRALCLGLCMLVHHYPVLNVC